MLMKDSYLKILIQITSDLFWIPAVYSKNYTTFNVILYIGQLRIGNYDSDDIEGGNGS